MSTPSISVIPRAWVWPTIIIGLLGSHVTLCIGVMAIANSDPAFAVVDDYHEKALAWDEHMAEVRASESLGWSAELKIGSTRDVLNRPTLTLLLTDRQGAAIDHAAVTVTAFSHSRAAAPIEVTLHRAGPGRFASPVLLDRHGLWEFRVTATRGIDRFVAIKDLMFVKQ